ncbi:MAG TPA: molecular chaperone GroEL [Caldilineae bacterium]|nr:molecular chaperone GroEL [Caldilineae bacterium]
MGFEEFKSFDELNQKLKKTILLSEEARDTLQAGMDVLASAARTTFGPRGRAVALGQGDGSPLVTFDGVKVAEEIVLPDPHQNMGAQLLRQAAIATRDKAGDGSTATIILAQEICREGIKNIAAGANPMLFRRGLAKGAAAAQVALERMSRPLRTMDETVQVAIAASDEPEIGELVGELITRLGPDGFIHIQEDFGPGVQVEYHEGMHWYGGYLSTAFITDQETGQAILEDPYVLVTDRKISQAEELIPIMERLSQADEPRLLVIAEAVTGSALATLVVNQQQGRFRCLAVKPPAYGALRKAMFRDIAVLTGATLLSDEIGRPLSSVTPADLGRVNRVIATHKMTTLIGGKGDPSQIERRIREIRTLVELTQSKTERDKLRQRLARLAGGVAIVQVGGLTEAQRKERRRRLTNALSAVRGAVHEGVVVGGGVALLNAIPALDEVKAENDEEAAALRCMQRAFEAPLRQLAANAGEDGGAVVGQVRWLQQKLDNPNIGYDVLRREYGDLSEMGILDPLPVVRAVLRNAVSVAWILLSTETCVGVIPGQKIRWREPSERQRLWAAKRADLWDRARRAGGRLKPPRRVWPKPEASIKD